MPIIDKLIIPYYSIPYYSMGRNCHGPKLYRLKLLWAEIAMGRNCYGPKCPVTVVLTVAQKGMKYRSTSLWQTCLSQVNGIFQSDHPFPSISPILLCISNMFMSNLVITKSRLYRSGFSFPKLVFRFFTTTCVKVNFVLVKKLNNFDFKQSN